MSRLSRSRPSGRSRPHWYRRYRWSRRWHRLRALCLGYFWITCPLCGNHFGGHEWQIDEPDGLPGTNAAGRAICPPCTRAGRGRYTRRVRRRSRV